MKSLQLTRNPTGQVETYTPLAGAELAFTWMAPVCWSRAYNAAPTLVAQWGDVTGLTLKNWQPTLAEAPIVDHEFSSPFGAPSQTVHQAAAGKVLEIDTSAGAQYIRVGSVGSAAIPGAIDLAPSSFIGDAAYAPAELRLTRVSPSGGEAGVYTLAIRLGEILTIGLA